jgi:hypothetical protein
VVGTAVAAGWQHGHVNADWHREHVLGSQATLDQRVEWHLAHAEACACRELPESIRAELLARGLTPPEPRER